MNSSAGANEDARRGGGTGTDGGAEPGPGAPAGHSAVSDRTRISAAWVTAIVGALVLILLLIFILQNQDGVTVTFLGLSGSLPLGVALLLAAVAGALLVALLGAARILQLRRRFRRAGRQD
ncbi:lipopolysaccharide assembly protein LapA domain-containing protein [Amycolatopsis aidingensis]|uniref:lipopolysaccharide assembly protein LapA domain-containing protein n=1 Tax=Amycolatopsis aidingensis TaxID=2842453 RepID=UPI001C0BCC7B|nr:lipopolysaccharide assembly protein LapA domain-containing protein [Amycolatopsis aidingensis]